VWCDAGTSGGEPGAANATVRGDGSESAVRGGGERVVEEKEGVTEMGALSSPVDESEGEI
jgi:hypothetical protein